jgi:hypothetical protein
MEDMGIPFENQEPLNNQNPMDDSTLDDLERSIENPPGFMDPLFGQDEQLMDDLAKRLDAVENSIENAPPLQAESELIEQEIEPDICDDEAAESEEMSSAEDYERSEVQDISESEQPSDSLDSSVDKTDVRPHLPELPGRRSGNIPRRRGYPLKRPFSRRVGNARVRKGSNLRLCPETHELIDQQKCQSCQKYRHWPGGTNEEPRECWHDWQAEQPSDESDEEGDDEEGF